MSNTLLFRRRHAGGLSPYILTLLPLAVGGVSFTFTQRGTGSVEYSTDGITWTQFVSGQPTATIAQNTPVFVRGGLVPIQSTTWTDAGIGTFSADGNFSVKGCLASMLGAVNIAGSVPDYAYVGLFANCSTLVDARELRVQSGSVGQYGYAHLFDGCANLIAPPPSLPALSVNAYGYNNMFANCATMQTAPTISAISVGVWSLTAMFSNCTSLVDAPNLYAESLPERAYSYMFGGCTSLLNAPSIAAISITGAMAMSFMFHDCSALQVAPELKFTTLAIDLNCCLRIFENCTSLRSIKVNFTAWGYGNFSNWVNNVATTGVFNCKAALPVIYGPDNIPNNWAVSNF